MRRQKYPSEQQTAGFLEVIRTVSDRSDTVPEPPIAAISERICGCPPGRHRNGCWATRNRPARDEANVGTFVCSVHKSRNLGYCNECKDEADRRVSLPLAGAEEWAGKRGGKVPRKKSTSASQAQITRAVNEFEESRRVRAWDEMQAQHFLGLYIVCHRRVYGVDPSDLFVQWAGAISAVKSMLAKEFGGAPEKMVAYCQWAWAREQGREKHRRSNGGGDFRLAWRFLFVRQAAAGMLTDWRTSLARAAKTRADVKPG